MTVTKFSIAQSPLALAVEYALIFLAIPAILYVYATRWNIHLALWIVSIYAVVVFCRAHRTSWHEIWHGQGWAPRDRKIAAVRFLVATALVILAAGIFLPDHLFSFPMRRPVFWVIVMILYPILSVIPQEFVFRSFFFQRYAILFKSPAMLAIANTLSFGLMHIVFHNWVSPLLCLIAGAMLAHSYQQHRALKWAVIEHAAYGCMVFTVGIGGFFLVGGMAR